MTPRQHLWVMRQFRSILPFLFCTLLFTAAALPSQAADLKLEAKLIWGTNDESTNANHKILNAKQAESLLRTFKWKFYYEITNKVVSIPADKTGSLQMSSHCELKVKNLGSSRVEVSCFGKGKFVSKGVHLLPCTIGGGDKNNTAWFIMLRSTEAKVADAKK